MMLHPRVPMHVDLQLRNLLAQDQAADAAVAHVSSQSALRSHESSERRPRVAAGGASRGRARQLKLDVELPGLRAT